MLIRAVQRKHLPATVDSQMSSALNNSYTAVGGILETPLPVTGKWALRAELALAKMS